MSGEYSVLFIESTSRLQEVSSHALDTHFNFLDLIMALLMHVLYVFSRLVGDLIYQDVTTLEGNKLCITGTTKMFYVNSSMGNVLDPRPCKAASESATLIGLMQKISPKFKKGKIAWLGSISLYVIYRVVLVSVKFLILVPLLKLFGKFWSGKLLHIRLRMSNHCYHQIRGLDYILFQVSSILKDFI